MSDLLPSIPPDGRKEARDALTPQLLRTPMRDLFPASAHLQEHFDDAIERVRRAARRRTITTRIGNFVFYGLLLAFSGWFIGSAIDRDVPVDSKVDISTEQVPQGSDLVMRVTPKRLKLCETRIIFRAWDRLGNVVNRTETEWAFPVGKLGDDMPFNRPIRISGDAVVSLQKPDSSFIRDSRMRIERNFYCNPVQKFLGWPIVEVTPDQTFSVVPKKP